MKPSKATVELSPEARPSRIRRDPVRAVSDEKPTGLKMYWDSREWEIRLAIIGIIFFALGVNAVVFVASWITG